ncbi:acyl-CoA dehydrogenase family protein [Lentzea sp. NPDC058450]|uniref:acyl-CoA dehydrogenase family protein n=1 Tax=Lentzea sp. NPDC058450 TaxID=3346505 RepID=UPI003669B32C
MADHLSDARALVGKLIGDQADGWDLTGALPMPLLRELSSRGLLCAQVPVEYDGLGFSSLENGELTAYTGSLCSSVRSVQTSHGMSAWTIGRLGDKAQRRAYLPTLAMGGLAAICFSEPDAGSDLSGIGTVIVPDGDEVVVTGRKTWITAAAYADLLLVVGRFGDGAGVVVVPRDAPGVRVEPVAHPAGCRAAGHSEVRLDAVRLPADAVLGGGGQNLSMVITTALTYGRMSVAWGCVGILRACLREATAHAASRTQFGKPLHEHQLVAKRLAEIFVGEQVSTLSCAHASRSWDSGDPELAMAAVFAKHVSSTNAAQAAASAMQVLASRAAHGGTVIERAYRDAKLMEIIEGTSEICQLLLAEQAIAAGGGTDV